MAEPFTFSESIQPIPLPEAGTTPEGEAIISGWGTGAKDLPQYAQVPIISYDGITNPTSDFSEVNLEF